MVITVRGDLDIVTSPQLDEFLTAVEDTHTRIILDLADVDFLDTSALAVIVGHWKKAEAAGGALGTRRGPVPVYEDIVDHWAGRQAHALRDS